MARNAIESYFAFLRLTLLKVDADDDGQVAFESSAATWHSGPKQMYNVYWSEMGKKCDQKWFSSLTNGRREPFYEKISKIAINAIEAIFGHPDLAGSLHVMEFVF